MRSPDKVLFVSTDQGMEPTLGFEPRTCCLRNSCSTTELCRRRTSIGADPAIVRHIAVDRLADVGREAWLVILAAYLVLDSFITPVVEELSLGSAQGRSGRGCCRDLGVAVRSAE